MGCGTWMMMLLWVELKSLRRRIRKYIERTTGSSLIDRFPLEQFLPYSERILSIVNFIHFNIFYEVKKIIFIMFLSMSVSGFCIHILWKNFAYSSDA